MEKGCVGGLPLICLRRRVDYSPCCDIRVVAMSVEGKIAHLKSDSVQCGCGPTWPRRPACLTSERNFGPIQSNNAAQTHKNRGYNANGYSLRLQQFHSRLHLTKQPFYSQQNQMLIPEHSEASRG